MLCSCDATSCLTGGIPLVDESVPSRLHTLYLLDLRKDQSHVCK